MALFRYPGKKTWWYEFHLAGQKVRESAKTRSKEIARRAEAARRRQMEEGYHGLKKRAAPRLFSAAPDEWLTLKKPTISERSCVIEQANLKHLFPEFGPLLITDIDGKKIGAYQQERLKADASPKTVNLEIGPLRAIMRRNRLWAEIQPDMRMLPTRDDVGRAISPTKKTHAVFRDSAAEVATVAHYRNLSDPYSPTIAAPRWIAGALQRAGRARHSGGRHRSDG
jgi:hypothetical protein